MPTVKVLFRLADKSDSNGFVCYRISIDRQFLTIRSTHCLRLSQWQKLNLQALSDTDQIRQRIKIDTLRIRKIISTCRLRGSEFSVSDIADEYLHFRQKYSFKNYMTALSADFRRQGRTRTSETYAAAMRSFMRFCNGADIQLDYITARTALDYEGFLRAGGLTKNTISFYMRILRAAYNRAVSEGEIDDARPFRNVYTGIDKTVKRALPLTAIRRIKDADLSGNRMKAFSRDIFMLSFYMRGMAFVDIAYLRKSDISNGLLVYRRKKTGGLLSIKWTPEMQEIIDRYPARSSTYLLPIIPDDTARQRSCYRNASYKINYHLRRLAESLRIGFPLTLYCARHSWASAARTNGVPLSVISEGMGHSSESMTRIYLASLDTSTVDRANRMIIRSLAK